MECSQDTGVRPVVQPVNNLPHAMTEGDATLGAYITQPPAAVFFFFHLLAPAPARAEGSSVEKDHFACGRKVTSDGNGHLCVWKDGILLHSHETAHCCSVQTLPKGITFFP